MASYLGIDASTQGVKAIVIDVASGLITSHAAVDFGNDLPEYHSPDGILYSDDPKVCHADPRMWLDGLELVLVRLRENGADLSKIEGISGAAQQHGSVYLRGKDFSIPPGAEKLSDVFASRFSRKSSPIWMDHSTVEECRELTEKFGDQLCRRTGSPAVERFTGPQIRRFARKMPWLYAETERIHLVSSFLCSVLCGREAPIDFGDGAGMNLLDLHTLEWNDDIVEFTAPDLLKKLPPVGPSGRIAGKLDQYFTRFGLAAGIPVTVWTGDNPSSLIGMGGAEPGTAVVSLGTSDTLFASMKKFQTDPKGDGHVFGNPAGGFMSLICFANGSLAREKMRDDCGVDWKFFDESAEWTSHPGNDGRLMLPYYVPECTPQVASAGIVWNFEAEKATPAEKIRALLESQALRMRIHSQWMPEHFQRLYVTGGASGSVFFQHILADVFQVKVESIEVSNSCALGAAMRAAAATEGISFDKLAEKLCGGKKSVQPNRNNAGIYEEAAEKYTALESAALSAYDGRP